MYNKTLRVLAGASALSLALAASSAWAQTKLEMPKYGGSLEISTVYATISALSFDSYDWPWKHNHDTGGVYEQLFAADLSKAKSRGGKFRPHIRRLYPVAPHPRRARREMGVAGEPAAPRRSRCARA